MSTHLYSNRRNETALTVWELLLVVAVLAIVAVIILPGLAPQRRRHEPIIRCMNNLKQVGLAFQLWAHDNAGKFPMHVPIAKGGTLELVGDGKVAPHFVALSNELATPKILVCRVDLSREAATNFVSLHETNVSYFVNLSAREENSEMWLAGDRNLAVGRRAAPSMVDMTADTEVDWSQAMHNKRGAIAFADGSVRQMTSQKLAESLRAQTNYPFRLAVPQ